MIKNLVEIEKIPYGYSRHKILTDRLGEPVDYIFLDANSAFEKMTGIDSENVLGKKVTEILPGFAKEDYEWIKLCGQTSLTGETLKFIKFSNSLSKWYEVSLFSDETGYFTALFNDITECQQNKRQMLKNMEDYHRSLEGVILSMGVLIHKRDNYTANHQIRVSRLSVAIAQEMGLDKEKIKGLKLAADIHDIGKVTIPSEILVKPGPLNDLEVEILKTHSEMGYEIIKNISFPWPLADIVKQHHEKINGGGYPDGVLGKDILIEAKIICVADVVDSIASNRPYRPAKGIDRALAEISDNMGILYDRDVCGACLKIFENKSFIFEP